MLYAVLAPSTGYIKLGYTENETTFKSRLGSLQTGNGDKLVVLKTMDGAPEDEKALHERFAGDRLCGEWFMSSPELLTFLNASEGSPAAAAMGRVRRAAYEDGWRAHKADFDAAVAKRCEVLEGRTKEAYKRNQAYGRALAQSHRVHNRELAALADSAGIDLEAWTNQYRRTLMRGVWAKVPA
jgi:hypothetical protein